MRRVAISIASNICRKTNKDQSHFSTVAYSSTVELLNNLKILNDLKFLTGDKYKAGRDLIEKANFSDCKLAKITRA